MSDPLDRFRSFLRELKRRKVYRVAVVYAAVAFVVVEAADLIFPALNIPSWGYSLVVVLALLGFPLALVLAWAFDLTPEGVRRERASPGPEKEPEAEGESASAPGSGWSQSRIAGTGLVALGLLAAAAAGGWYLVAGGSPTPEPTVTGVEELDVSRVVVFPFTIRSGEGLSDWSEGMVELMGRSLDGAGSLQAVDPNTLLSRIEAKPGDGLDADSARRIAARFGAGRYVLGSIYQLGDSLRLSATWYRTDGTELGSADVTGTGEGDLQQMVDELARSAIADLTGEAVERRERLAAQTTSSVEALKAYLAGQEAFRDGEFSTATNRFSEAVERDSSFALAHYRLSLAARWSGQDLHLAHRAARRAVELSDDLPERDRRFLRANFAFGTGEADRAERLYRLLLQSHPQDVEAWYMLGETLFHFNAVRGRPLTESRRPFRRAIELDSTFVEPLPHLVHLALLERDTARVDSLMGAVDEVSTYGIEAIFQVIREGSSPETVESAFRPLRSRDPVHAMVAVHGLSVWDQEAAYEAIRPWTETDQVAEVRAMALLMQADLLASRGELEAARTKIRTVAPLDTAAYWGSRGHLAALPYLPASDAGARERRDVRQGLRGWNAEQVPEREATLYLDPPELYAAGRLYLLGLLHAEAGETEEALRTAEELEFRDPPLLASSGPADFARSIRAEVDRQENRPGKALSRLEAIEHRINDILPIGRLYSYARERYLRAELLAELGQPEEALRWYRSVTGLSWGERAYLGPARLGEARALEELGRTEEAIQQYRRFVDLWHDADSILQPRVEEARQALNRLTSDTMAASSSAGPASDLR